MSQPNAAPTLTRAQVSTSLPPMHYQQVLAALGFKQHQVPLHLALRDASGDAALIEYTSKGVGCCLGQQLMHSAPRARWCKCGESRTGVLTHPAGRATAVTAGVPASPLLHPCLLSLQAEVYWGATVVTNDPTYPVHQKWNKKWMAEVE